MLDDLFRTAVSAIDAGKLDTLDQILREHPTLACERLESPGAWLTDTIGKASEGFFQRPYLLWFVAEDPVRNGKLPSNTAAVAGRIIDAARASCAGSLQEQLDYALRLVAWSWIARECGVQIALLDVLIDAGASLEGGPDNALVNDNVAAAEHLVSRGAPVTLATALCLGRWDDVTRLASSTTDRGKQMAFVLASLRGKAEAVRRMIEIGIDVNAVSPDLYSHATPLHHAVCSGSLDAVRVLVEAGARLITRDTAYDGTPLDWAEHYGDKPGYPEIAAYLRERQRRPESDSDGADR
jgi:peptide-methionine (S)-S-oxide reductase